MPRPRKRVLDGSEKDPIFFQANPPPTPGGSIGGVGSAPEASQPIGPTYRVVWHRPPAHWSDEAYARYYAYLDIPAPPRTRPQAFPAASSAPPPVRGPDDRAPPVRGDEP